MARRTLRLALLVVLVVGISVGTTGFSAVGADRTVSVSVVDDDEAYVGVVACEKSGTASGSDPVRLWVENRNAGSITVESVTSDDAVRRSGNAVGEEVRVGDRDRFELVFERDVSTVTVAVAGDGLDVTVTRDVTPKANCPYSTGTQNATETETTATTSTPTQTSTTTQTSTPTPTPTA